MNKWDFLSDTEPVSRVFGLDRGVPIDRFYIETFLENESIKYDKGKMSVLEVGESKYSKRFFPNSEHYVLNYKKDMDLTKPETLPQNRYDVFICTQTLNFVYDVRAAIRGCHALIRSGGVFLATVAGNISQVSKYDMDRWGDYWRFTYKSIDMLVKETFGSDVQSYPYGNAMAATAFIQGLCLDDVDKELLNINDPEYAIVIGVVAKKEY